MPGANHWISTGWQVTLPAIVTAVFGIRSVPDMPTVEAAIFCVLFLATIGLTWWQAARQSEQSERDEDQLKALIDQLTPAPDIRDLPAALIDLRNARSEDIRARVAAVTGKMRAMEHAFMEAQRQVLQAPREDWATFTNQVVAQSQEHQRQWHAELMPEAVSLWNEMRRRIYGAPPYPEDPMAEVALSRGALAGPSPLNEAALTLERLAREMP